MNTTEHDPQISTQDLMALGMNDLAYVKSRTIDGQTVFAVHAADGSELIVLPSQAMALAAIRRHDMWPVSVH